VAGQQEGRPTCPDNEAEAALQLDVIAACQNPNDQPGYPVAPEGAKLHAFDELVDALQDRLIGARGLVVSISHDRYIDNIGGTQLCIADEQDRFMSDRFCYLHISPSIARLTLAREEDFSCLQVCINGIFIGLAEPADLARAIQHCRDMQALARAMIVHCVLGHAPSALIGIWKALQPHHSFWWLHDFSTVCEGFHLLRNKVKYCKGTGVNSLSCRVCAYGATRERHVARIHALFEQIPFRMLAPSASALEIWRGSCDLPYLDAGVHAHSALENPTPIPNNTPLDAPMRVAFIGYTGVHKGYQHFDRLTKMLRDRRDVEFYHFASEHKHPELPRVIHKEVKVTRKDPQAMVSALQGANIDLVLMLSPWPETFSYVCMEALASGADIVAFEDGGNAAALTRTLSRGVVLRDADALFDFFQSGKAVAYVGCMRAAGKFSARLRSAGTTATINPAVPLGQCAPVAETVETNDPCVLLAAGGLLLTPERQGDVYVFELPHSVASFRLISRTCVPIWVIEGTNDIRHLGIAVTGIYVDDAHVPLGDKALGAGWHEPELGFRWTNGNATLNLPARSRVMIGVAHLVKYRPLPFVLPEPDAGRSVTMIPI